MHKLLLSSILCLLTANAYANESNAYDDRRYTHIYVSVPASLSYNPTSDSHEFHWAPVQVGAVLWNTEKTGRFAFGKLAVAPFLGFTPGEKMDGHLGLVLSPVLLKLVRMKTKCHYDIEQSVTFDVGYDVFNTGVVFALGVLIL